MTKPTPHPTKILLRLYKNRFVRYTVIMAMLALLGYSFWFSQAWLTLCYGLALFLFGMQCIEMGLHHTAGGTLEKLMAKSTQSPVRGFGFGMVATFILQSSTLVSLLTIAFLSTGMIGLAGGLSIIFGTNLGATSGIWLLALAGQNVSLNAFALPMIVFGVLMGFFDKRLKAFGQALIGIALIFLGIDAIKEGFGTAQNISFSDIHVHGFGQVLMFTLIGFLLTCVLQSSHATLILTLSALSSGQISLTQGFAIAVGSNLGSSATTALVGMISGDKNGQRLALAHLIFNAVTATLSLILWLPMTYGTLFLADFLGLDSNLLILALFHTLFNLMGIVVFWAWQDKFAQKLIDWLPSSTPTAHLPDDSQPVKPKYLQAHMLVSTDTAMHALTQEIRHLTTLGLEVVCHAIYVENDELYRPTGILSEPNPPLHADVQTLYSWQIKPIYSAILDFTSQLDIEGETGRQKLTNSHMKAFHTVQIVKESKHLQKNMQKFLRSPNELMHRDYLQLRQQVFELLLAFLRIHELPTDDPARQSQYETFVHQAKTPSHSDILKQVHAGNIDGIHASSLINDLNYVHRIHVSLAEMLQLEHE